MTSATLPLSQKEQNRYIIAKFRDRDAPALPGLFRRIYGDHYLCEAVYDPNAYRRANASGTGRSLIARGPGDEPVGHLAILRSAPHPGGRELGQGVVDPDHRTQGLLGRLIGAAIRLADGDPGCCGLFGAALTSHMFSQRALWRADFVDVGFEIGYVPARMMRIEATGRGPTATVLQYRALDDAPGLAAHLPRAYRDVLLALYDQLGLTRAFATGGCPLDRAGRGRVTVTDRPRFDLVRLDIRRIGSDLAPQARDALVEAQRKGRAMVQAVVPLESPFADAAVEALRAAGFWFGALLPRWVGADALLLQRAVGTPWFEGIDLYTNDARALLRFVRQDAMRQPVPA